MQGSLLEYSRIICALIDFSNVVHVIHCLKSYFFQLAVSKCSNIYCITDMFVIDHKENVSLINHKIVCDKTRTFCYYSYECQNVQ